MSEWDVVAETPLAAQPASTTNVGNEWSVVNERTVPGTEVARRAGSSFLNAANAYAAAPAIGAARLVDAAHNYVGKESHLADFIADRFVQPSMNAIERNRAQPGEKIGPVGGAVLEAAPELGKAVPDVAEGAGLMRVTPKAVTAAGGALRTGLNLVREGFPAGVPAGVRTGIERSEAMREHGVDPLTADLQGAQSGLMTAATFGLPLAAPSAASTLAGRIIQRGAQGGAISTASGASQRAIENAILPDRARALHQDVGDLSRIATDAALGVLLGQMSGKANPRLPSRESLVGPQGERYAPPEPPLELAPAPAREPRPEQPPSYDPISAAREVNEKLHAMPEGAPEAPPMQLVPKGQEVPAGRQPQPDVSEVPVRVAPQLDIQGVRQEIAPPEAGRVETVAPAVVNDTRVVAPQRVQREVGEPPIPIDQVPAMRTAEQVADTSDRMKPNVPMRILHTIDTAARDSGLEKQITPRIEQLEGPAHVITDEEAPPKPAEEQPAPAPQPPPQPSAEAQSWADNQAARIRAQRYAEENGIDTRGKTPEQVDKAIEDHAARRAAEVTEGVSDADMENLKLVARASEIDEVGVGRLAVQHADGGPAFMDGIRRIIENGESTTAGQGVENVQVHAEQSRPAGDVAGNAGDGARAEGIRGSDSTGERAGDAGGEPHAADAGGERTAAGDERVGTEVRRDQLMADRNEAINERRDLRNAGQLTPERKAKLDAEITDLAERITKMPREGGGGTFHSNPFADPAVVSKAFKWAFGDADSWTRKVKEVSNDIQDLRSDKPKDSRNAVHKFMRAAFDSYTADMDSAVRSNGNSKTAGKVMDALRDVAGRFEATKETLPSAVRHKVNEQLVKLDRLLGTMTKDREVMKQIANLVRNPANIKPGSPIHDAAAGVRSMLDETLKYMRDAGVEVGEVKGGYFPREFDIGAVTRDGKAFIDAVTRAYRDEGMAPDVARVSAQELHDGLLFGEGSSLFRAQGATPAPFLKGRVFGKGVDLETHPLNRFLVHDPALALSKYFERAAKRAEIARRFGDNFSDWQNVSRAIVQEGGGAVLKDLTEYVAAMTGSAHPGMSERGMRLASYVRTWGALMFLEKATLSSLTEFMVPALRSGNVMDMGRSLRSTIADLVGKTKGAEERRAFAEDLGLVAGHIHSALSSARFAGGDPVGRMESRILDEYFKRTGLNQWTDATRVAAADNARIFVRRLAKDMEKGGQLTKKFLAELGVPTEQAADFAKYVLSKNGGMPVAGDLKGPMGELYRTSVRKFVSQSIMDPNAGTRPAWMNHPFGALIGQLQAFNYAFYENVLKRNTRLMSEAAKGSGYTAAERAQMVAPMLMLPLITAAAFGIGEARDELLGDPQHRKEETGLQKTLKAVSRGTPIAPVDPLINALSASRYNRSITESLAGPTLGSFGRAADASIDYFLKNSERTNTQERRLLKSIWDVFVEPSVNLALSVLGPVPGAVGRLAPAVATQAAGSGRVREESLVTPVAGAEQPSGKRGGSSNKYLPN